MGGFHRRVAFVDLTRESVDVVDISHSLQQSVLGGRGLGVALLALHGPCREPLEDDAQLCLMAGPLTGSDFPLANRLALVFRSPLTRTVAWAMTGGYIATEMSKGGLDGIVVSGRAKQPCYLQMRGSQITVQPASHLWGLGAVETVSRLKAAHADAHALAIGPAGERLSPVATVINDKGRASGVRHGVGSVFGSKQLKGIVVERTGGPTIKPNGAAAWRDLLARLQQQLRASPLLSSKSGSLAVHGTPIAVEALGRHEALPTHNYRRTRLEGHEAIGGRRMSETVLRARLTCSHCPVRCRREVGAEGKYRHLTEGPDYSQLSSLGSNCEVRDLEALGYMNHLCYELGLDPIEVGNGLALLAELTEIGEVRDGLRWGDADRMIELIHDIGAQQGLGQVLSGGVTSAALTFGAPGLAMSVKGISLQNVDPRPEPAWGLLNATESFGSAAHVWTYADLVTALADAGVRPLVSPNSTPREIASAVRYRQDLVAVLDSLTSCAFSSYAFSLEDYAEAMALVTDEPCTPSALLLAGERMVNQERAFNRANGFTAADDTLPTRFTEEPVLDGIHAGKVCSLQAMLDEYYALRGWPDEGRETAMAPVRSSTSGRGPGWSQC
jgi:aldehyde:ferredoxin oxidoreductase